MKSLTVLTIVVLLATVGLAGDKPDEPAKPIKPIPRDDRYQAYWLVAPATGDRTEYQRLLVTRGPIEQLAGVKSGSKLLFDNAAMTFQTYKRDSLWEDPFRSVQQFGAVDAKAKTAVVDGSTYLYEPCPLEDVVGLLEKPEGTIPIHRRVHPLSGAEQTTKAFRLLLQEQMKAKK